jgi:hypothetical protein
MCWRWQWDKLKSRLDKGEKAADLAREYGVTRQVIGNRFSGQIKAVKEVANQIVESELSLQKNLQKLTPTLQLSLTPPLASYRCEPCAITIRVF